MLKELKYLFYVFFIFFFLFFTGRYYFSDANKKISHRSINEISKKIDISSGLEDNPGVKSSKKVSDFLSKVKKLR